MRSIVVGGGLTGLASAVHLARAGHTVTLLEGASQLGGRARTTDHDGALLNLGPHALSDRAAAGLRALGVTWTGGRPPTAGAWGLRGGERVALPATAWGLLASPWLSWRGRAQVARFLGQVMAGPPEGTVDAWLARTTPDDGARDVASALVRVSTYTNDGQADARAVADQLAGALGGVTYVDGGWQALVDGLRRVAMRAGVTLRTGAAVRRVDDVVHTDRGELAADRVVLAVGPATAARLLGLSAPAARPAAAACLDLVLSAPPPADRRFVLGLDVPVYIGVHSDVARLAPDGAVCHAAWYRAPGDTTDRRGDLERALDRSWPGWRDRVVHARYLPRMVVQHDVPRPGRQPLPTPPHVHVAGAWTGGFLLDGALTSAAGAVARRAAA